MYLCTGSFEVFLNFGSNELNFVWDVEKKEIKLLLDP